MAPLILRLCGKLVNRLVGIVARLAAATSTVSVVGGTWLLVLVRDGGKGHKVARFEVDENVAGLRNVEERGEKGRVRTASQVSNKKVRAESLLSIR